MAEWIEYDGGYKYADPEHEFEFVISDELQQGKERLK